MPTIFNHSCFILNGASWPCSLRSVYNVLLRSVFKFLIGSKFVTQSPRAGKELPGQLKRKWGNSEVFYWQMTRVGDVFCKPHLDNDLGAKILSIARSRWQMGHCPVWETSAKTARHLYNTQRRPSQNTKTCCIVCNDILYSSQIRIVQYKDVLNNTYCPSRVRLVPPENQLGPFTWHTSGTGHFISISFLFHYNWLFTKGAGGGMEKYGHFR